MAVYSKLIRLRTNDPIQHPLLAFDTEDDGKGNFTYGHVYGYRGHWRKPIFVDRGFDTKEELAEFLNGVKRCLIVGKNVDYDLCNLEPFIKIKKLYGKSRFILGKTSPWTDDEENEHYNCKVFDIQNHLDGTLEELMPLVGMEKLPLKLNDRAAMIERCKSDAKATYLLAERLEKWYVKNGSKLRSTIAACALEIFKRRFFKHQWKRLDSFNDFERTAYRGGRVEVFDRRRQVVKSYDVNSMYLSQMADHVFPDPNTVVHIEGKKHFEKYFYDYQGIVEVTVKVPQLKYPPLPYFHPDLRKLIFPVGSFRGVWTFEELKYAISCGAEILILHRYNYYNHSYPYFCDFARWVWSERKRAKNKFDNLMIKKVGNALYGKFGQREEKGLYYGKLCNFQGKIDSGVKPLIITQGGVEYLLITQGKLTNSPHTFTVISAYVSSFARIALHREMVKHNTVYCDTDSLKITDTIKSSDKLGAWKFEGKVKFKAWRPKLYESNGKITCKGVPKGNSLIKLFKDELIATFEKPYRFKEALHAGKPFNLWEKRRKRLKLNDVKRVYDRNGSSKPICLSL